MLNVYESDEKEQRALALAKESDVVILGSAPERYLIERMKENKLSFRYTERPLKKGIRKLFNLHVLNTMLHLHTRYAFKKLYLLCASAYTAKDCALVGGYWNKAYKWGYFPEVREYSEEEFLRLKENNEKTRILWAGRLIPWKHPEYAIRTAKMLKDNGYEFSMDIIGTGELDQSLRELAKSLDVMDVVNFLGSMSPTKVRQYMEQADIYLFTSNRQEGWGAVLNESMCSGCAVIANRSIGAAPFLLTQKENGLLYKDGNLQDLYRKVVYCIEHPEECKRMGRQAYKTMTELWNARVAAERLIDISKKLLDGGKYFYKEGPGSRAKWL